MTRRFGEHRFERPTHITFEEVTAQRGAVRVAEDDVRVSDGFAFSSRATSPSSDTTSTCSRTGMRVVLLGTRNEIAEHGIPKGADSRDLGSIDSLLDGEAVERRHGRVPGVEDSGEGARFTGVVSFHFMDLALGRSCCGATRCQERLALIQDERV
jgi:hypothetical protein